MKFDSNLAWSQATAAMAAHRELLLALAGVFFFLPSFALIMLAKQPHVPANAKPEQVMAVLEPFAASVAPWIVVGSIVQWLGQLTLVELFGGRGRSTVAQALRNSVSVMATYIVVQLVTSLVMGLLFLLALALGSLIHQLVGLVVAVYVVCQAYAYFVTAGAVIVLEDKLNPITVLTRAIAVARGSGFRIGNFLFLLVIAALFLLAVLSIILGIFASLVLGEGRGAEIVTGFASSAASAFVLTYFVAIIVAIYRQLAGDVALDRSA
jgi:hypothetical protein